MNIAEVAAPAVAALLGAGIGVALRSRAARDRLRVARAEAARVTSELDRFERSTAREHEVQDLILESMHDGVLLLGPGGEVAFANGALARHLGSKPTGTRDLLPHDMREAVERAAASGQVASALVETGSPLRWLRAVATPAGASGAVLLVVRDVTEARRLDAVRRDFVANASHELKTPAATIQAAAEMLKQAAADDPGAVPQFAAQLEREAFRLSRIVADLLDLSRLESGSELDEVVHLDALVREEAQRFADRARDEGLSLDVDAAATGAIRGSARDLSLLVRNLIDNAIRHTQPGGRVEISVAEDGETAVLSIADTGVGIPSKDLPRIFERFYRVDRARSRETGGTGLGLSIVRHVTENHGGVVLVQSELGRGTTFEIRLPLVAA